MVGTRNVVSNAGISHTAHEAVTEAAQPQMCLRSAGSAGHACSAVSSPIGKAAMIRAAAQGDAGAVRELWFAG